MKISHRNFMASQAFYGLAIAKQNELPPVDVPWHKWDAPLRKLVALSFVVADMQIAHSRKGKRKIWTTRFFKC